MDLTAIAGAVDNNTIMVGPGTYAETISVSGITLSIIGEVDVTVTGGAIASNGSGKGLTISGIRFVTSGLEVNGYDNVTIQHNTFTDINTWPTEQINAGSADAIYVHGSSSGTATITNNTIAGVQCNDTNVGDGMGITVLDLDDITITGNTISDTWHNSINIYQGITGTVSITGNTLSNWDSNRDPVEGQTISAGCEGGRALRVDLAAGASITVTDNTITPNDDTNRVDPQYVKITGVSTDNVNNLIGSLIDQNIWPSGTEYGTVILVNTTAGTNMAASITSESTTNYYPTIQAAIDGAIEGDTIKLLADVITTIGTCYHIRNSMTIDLNGYEISGPANGSCSDDGTNATHFFRVVSGTLTIDDTSAEKNGSIFCSYSGNSTALTVEILAGAKVVLNAGTLTNGTPYNYGGSVVYLRDTAEFTMNGGTVNGVKVLSNKRTYPIFIQGAACKFTMTGGIVTSDSDAISIPYNGAIVSISGGQLTGVPGSTALNPAYIADGSYCVFDGSKSTISETAPVAYTANINGKLYYTSSGGGNLAIAKAANGDTITLCEETTANKTLAASQTLAITIGEGGSYSGTVSTYAGYEVVSNVNGSTTTYSVALTPNSAIAEWNGTYYPTAYAALDAAYQANSDVAVVLLKDSAAITGIKGGILDLNGKKIEGSSSSGVIALSSLSSDYSLRVIDSVGGGQAINTYTNKAAVNAYYGTITIEAGTYTGNGTSNALTASAASGGKTAGTFIITGGTFNSDPTAYLATGFAANESDGVWVVTAVN